MINKIVTDKNKVSRVFKFQGKEAYQFEVQKTKKLKQNKFDESSEHTS